MCGLNLKLRTIINIKNGPFLSSPEKTLGNQLFPAFMDGVTQPFKAKMRYMRHRCGKGIRLALLLLVAAWQVGCATRVAPTAPSLEPSDTVAFGRITVGLTGPTTRIYPPMVRFFELTNHDSGQRYRIDVKAVKSELFLKLPPGTYELSRIMINEGAFQSLANPGPTFTIEARKANYIGTWQVGVGSPTFNRRISVTVGDDLAAASQDLLARYPRLSTPSITSQLPTPTESVTRLYETEPYPLIWWFRRHHTT